MVWYTTEDARRDALRQSANMERSGCAEELVVMAKNLAECKKTLENDSAVSALVEAANRLKATGCSSLCANGEPCSVAADGRCEAMPNAEVTGRASAACEGPR